MTEEKSIRLGFSGTGARYSRANAFTFFYAAFMTIGLLTFVSTGTAQILNAIGVPQDEQGTVYR